MAAVREGTKSSEAEDSDDDEALEPLRGEGVGHELHETSSQEEDGDSLDIDDDALGPRRGEGVGHSEPQHEGQGYGVHQAHEACQSGRDPETAVDQMTIDERQALIKAYEQRAQILLRVPQDALDRHLERMSHNDRLQYRRFFIALKAEKDRVGSVAARHQLQWGQSYERRQLQSGQWVLGRQWQLYCRAIA